MKIESRLVWQVFSVPFGFLLGAGLALAWTGGSFAAHRGCCAAHRRAAIVSPASPTTSPHRSPCSKFRVHDDPTR